jgi:uncharacterized coiled-coil protein SlyX
MFDAKPQDRDEIALFPREILTDHKMGPDGVLIEVDKIVFGKKGASNYEQIYEVPRLKRENPQLWKFIQKTYEGWKADRTLRRDGMALDAWPAITKGQIKACNDMGLFTVEDIATATDSIRQKLGIGANDLMMKAKAFIANIDSAKQAAAIAQLQATVEAQARTIEEQRETMDMLASQAGKSVRKPREREAA